ncbi:hypothetical protein G6M50_17740 [Agrobacterium rhizogenes]|nr:hypothetical protein [Rhizobium rhizogenes]NTJ79624.1 hypothetical protein [Rhizobium rhizogenes]
MAIDLVCRQFWSHIGCIGELATLAFNQRILMRDTKAIPVGSDRKSLEVDSKSWTGIGTQSESSQASVRSEYFNTDYICRFALWWSLAQVVFRIIEKIASGQFSLSLKYIRADFGFYIFYISFAAIAFVILSLRKMSRNSEKH